MEYLPYLIVPMAVAAVFGLIKVLNVKAEQKLNIDEKDFVVRLSKVLMWIGIIGTAFFGALIVIMIIFPNDTAEWWTFLIFALFCVLSVFLIALFATWKLRVTDEVMIYSSLFCRAKVIRFDSITKIKVKNQNSQYEQIIMYAGKKKVLALELFVCIGHTPLLARLRQEKISWDYC